MYLPRTPIAGAARDVALAAAVAVAALALVAPASLAAALPQLPTLAQTQQHQGIATGGGAHATQALALLPALPQLPTLAQTQQHQGIATGGGAHVIRALALLPALPQLPTPARIQRHQGIAVSAAAITAEVADAYAAHVAAGTTSDALFAEDAVLEDRSLGDRRVGRDAIFGYQSSWTAVLTFEPSSTLAGSAAAVVENTTAGFEYAVDVLRVRDGKIVAAYIYHDDLQQEPAEHAPVLLATPPGSGDTEAASRAVAKAYMTALRSLSPPRLAALYAAEATYQDTGRDVRYTGPSAAARGHAGAFALKGVRFQANGVLAGPGWAAVMWRRTDREGGASLVEIPAEFTTAAERPTIHGVSILEIRDGKIVRETIYCDHLRTVS